VAAPPNVCLEFMRHKTDGGRGRKKKKCLQDLCYSLAKGISGNLLDYGIACPRWGLMAKEERWEGGDIRIGGGNKLLR
jgi:hypothetical protein